MKTCTKCGRKLLLEEFNHRTLPSGKAGKTSWCRACSRIWYKAHRDRILERGRTLYQVYRDPKLEREKRVLQAATRFGFEPKEYRAALKAKWCPSCGRSCSGLVIHHNHATSEFVSFICRKCNSALGLLGDDTSLLKRLAEYIEYQFIRE